MQRVTMQGAAKSVATAWWEQAIDREQCEEEVIRMVSEDAGWNLNQQSLSKQQQNSKQLLPFKHTHQRIFKPVHCALESRWRD